MLLAGGLECVQLLSHFRADECGSFFDGGPNRGTVKRIWDGNLVGLRTPIRAPARVEYLFPVRGLDVVGIGQQILAFFPRNRINTGQETLDSRMDLFCFVIDSFSGFLSSKIEFRLGKVDKCCAER
jgi:hypothetical protein